MKPCSTNTAFKVISKPIKFEGLEVTRKDPKTSDFVGFPDGKLKHVFSFKVSGILNYLTTQDIMGKGASAQNKLNNKYKQACLQQRA